MNLRPALFYQHIQDTPASVWTVQHNLHDYPIIDVFVDEAGIMTKIIPAEITYIDGVTATITFSFAIAGVAQVG